jgi:hypothetical protein
MTTTRTNFKAKITQIIKQGFIRRQRFQLDLKTNLVEHDVQLPKEFKTFLVLRRQIKNKRFGHETNSSTSPSNRNKHFHQKLKTKNTTIH